MEEKTYLTVTALNKYIERKFKLDPYLGEVYIKGEISNFKPHGNNIYFSIKQLNKVFHLLQHILLLLELLNQEHL